MNLVTGDIIKIVFSFDAPDAVVMQNVYHYLMISGDAEDAEDVLDDIVAHHAVNHALIDEDIVDGVTGDVAKLSLWDSVLSQWDEIAAVALALFDGEAVGDMLPHGAAFVVRFFTEVGRRQGKKFLGGYDETLQVDGTWVAGAVTRAALWAAGLNDDIGSGGAVFRAGVFDEGPLGFLRFLTSSAANTIVGYQRRRKAGVGI